MSSPARWGLGHVIYGHREREVVPSVCGVGLIVLPYAVSGVAVLTLARLAVAAVRWLLRRWP